MSTQNYQGGCHCGAVRFAVTADLSGTLSCNCSICAKNGSILAFAPASAFTLTSGADNLTSYKFNRKVIDHLFCKTCGIRSFARGRMPDGTETVAINVRCLDGVDLAHITPAPFDGRSL